MPLKMEPDVETRARRLDQCVESDPSRLDGEPVFRGTRVPVASLFQHLRAGDSLDVRLRSSDLELIKLGVQGGRPLFAFPLGKFQRLILDHDFRN